MQRVNELLLVFMMCTLICAPAQAVSLAGHDYMPLEEFVNGHLHFVREATARPLEDITDQEELRQYAYFSALVERMLEKAAVVENPIDGAVALLTIGKYLRGPERLVLQEKAVHKACDQLRVREYDQFAWTGAAEIFCKIAGATIRTNPDEGREFFERADSFFVQGLLRMPENNFLWHMRAWNFLLLEYDVPASETAELRRKALDCFTESALLWGTEGFTELESFSRMADIYKAELADWREHQEVSPSGGDARDPLLKALGTYILAERMRQEERYAVLAAAIRAAQGDEAYCRRLLELAWRQGNLEKNNLADTVFDSFRQKEWFQQLSGEHSWNQFIPEGLQELL